jgi:hypothetical protein
MPLTAQVAYEKSQTSQGTGREIGWRDRCFFLFSLLGVLFLTFQAGVLVAVTKAPPYPWFRGAYQALESYLEQREILTQEWPQYLWNPTERTERGLVQHDPSRAFPGYTLYTSGHAGTAILIDMEGSEVHRWDAPFSSVWPAEQQGSRSIPDRFVFIRRGTVFPNGDLLALYETPADTPNGRGLAKLDRHGQVIWTYDAHAHHDFFLAPAGDIYVLTHRLTSLKEIHNDVIEDLVVHLDENGRELQTLSILKLLVTSPLVRKEVDCEHPRGDVTHSNTIQVIPAEFASHYDAISAGDLMVCLRNLNLVVVINPAREEIVWATSGPWSYPHDSEPLPNGNLLIFDNYALWGDESGSAVIEFSPQTRSTVWSYRGQPGKRLLSDIRACQQPLPGGNVLITESDGGRLLEVTRSGDVVWEFVNPVRGGDNEGLIPVVCEGTRYTREQLPFLDEIRATRSAATTGPAAGNRKLES